MPTGQQGNDEAARATSSASVLSAKTTSAVAGSKKAQEKADGRQERDNNTRRTTDAVPRALPYVIHVAVTPVTAVTQIGLAF